MTRSHILISAVVVLLTARVGSSQVFVMASPDEATSDVLNAASADFGDVDGDGDLDMFVASLSSDNRNHLFINSGVGSFTELPPSLFDQVRLNSAAGRFLDMDMDGDLDLFAGSLGGGSVLFENLGNGKWADRSDSLPYVRGLRQLSVIDLDADGDLDLFAAVRSNDNDVLLRNDGNGVFALADMPETTGDGGDSTCVEWMDADNDGDLDLFVCDATGDNRLYENTGDFQLVRRDVAGLTDVGGRTGGASWGDFDGDGIMDLYVANVDFQENGLYFNNGDWTFERIEEGAPVLDRLASNSSNAADFDNDGDIDLFVTNLSGGDRLYLNQGDGRFEWTGDLFGSNPDNRSASATVGDLDGDGDLDIHVSTLIGTDGQGGMNVTWDNVTTDQVGNNWIRFAVGNSPSGGVGVGARVDLFGSHEGTPFHQTRVLTSSRGSSIGGYQVSFGLGSASEVDSVLVRWVDQSRTRFLSPAVNMVHKVGTRTIRIDADPLVPVLPGDVTIQVAIDSSITAASAEGFYREVGDMTWRTGEAIVSMPGVLELRIPGVEEDVEYRVSFTAGEVTYLIGSKLTPLLLMVRQLEPRIHEFNLLRSGLNVQHHIGWTASTMDIDVGSLPRYSIWRSISNTSTKRSVTFDPNLVQIDPGGTLLSMNGELWEWLGDSPAMREDEYVTTQDALQSARGSMLEHTYRIIAHTSDPDIFHVSDSWTYQPEASSVGTEHTDVPEQASILELEPLWPNPSSGSVSGMLKVSVPGELSLSVYDALGRRIVSRTSGWVAAGRHSIGLDASKWAPGVYFVRVQVGSDQATRRMTLVE